MAVKSGFPFQAPQKTIDVGGLTPVAGIPQPSFPLAPKPPFPTYATGGQYTPKFFGGSILKSFKGLPMSTSDLSTFPLIIGWPGQFYYSSGQLLPSRPMAGSVIGSFKCYDPESYFGSISAPIQVPKAVISNDTSASFAIDSPETLDLLSEQGISLLLAQSPVESPGFQGFIGNYYPLLQAFPVNNTIDTGIFFNPDFVGPGQPAQNYIDFTIDPSCFLGGDILSFSWHPDYMPYTATYFDIGGVEKRWLGNIQNFTNPGGTLDKTTSYANGLLTNHVAQVNSVIGNFSKFRHVFVYDSNSSFNTWPSWNIAINAIIALRQDWIVLIDAKLSDPTTAASVIAEQVEDFFSS